MNYKTLTTLLAFALCLLACNEQKRFTTLPKKNWEGMNLHGKVKTMEVHEKIMPDFIEEGSSQSFNNNIYSILFFNTDGYLYQKKGYYDSGKPFVTIDYVYDDQHNLISETEVTFSDEGTPLRKEAILYKYNNKGLLIQKDEYLGDQYAFKTLFVYDEKGRCSQENKFIPPPIGKENDLTSQTTYSYNDKYYDLVKTTTYLEGETEADVVSYKYDNKNNVIEYAFWKKAKRVFTYNENNEELTQETFWEGKSKDKIIYKYQYDKHHNPVKITQEVEGDLYSIETRKYEYYDS